MQVTTSAWKRRVPQSLRSALAAPIRWMRPVFDPLWALEGMRQYPGFMRDLMHYRRLCRDGGYTVDEIVPYIHDKTATSGYDSHYFFQDLWAFKAIAARQPKWHLDVASRVDFVGFLTAVTRVVFVDIRPLEIELPNLEPRKGSVIELPFEDASVDSLSCLHVAEHIGLGRYGDPLDPQGTKKAATELARVLAPGGDFYFSLPIGRPRVCFNAQRVHSPEQILSYFPRLELVSFSAVDDDGRFVPTADYRAFSRAHNACGLFLFTKRC